MRLSAGDLVPADGFLVESRDLYVQQAALTGESMPVEKNATGVQRGRSESGAAELGVSRYFGRERHGDRSSYSDGKPHFVWIHRREIARAHRGNGI